MNPKLPMCSRCSHDLSYYSHQMYGVCIPLLAALNSSSSSPARYIKGVNFQEAYRQLMELQGEPDFVEKKYAATKLLMQHILTVRPHPSCTFASQCSVLEQTQRAYQLL